MNLCSGKWTSVTNVAEGLQEIALSTFSSCTNAWFPQCVVRIPRQIVLLSLVRVLVVVCHKKL
jgi:hypothetical protein